eukprot:COSAG06_NODE_12_length_35417_cov_270.698992_23_plen_34_part_00
MALSGGWVHGEGGERTGAWMTEAYSISLKLFSQ